MARRAKVLVVTPQDLSLTLGIYMVGENSLPPVVHSLLRSCLGYTHTNAEFTHYTEYNKDP